MILTLGKNISQKSIDRIVSRIKELGFTPHISKGKDRLIIGVIGHNAVLSRDIFGAMPEVDFITPISKPYKLCSREFRNEDSIIKTGEVTIGGKTAVVMAGPCSVENEKTLFTIAEAVKKAGAKILRGGAFKPRTSPYSFQGLGVEGLKLLKAAGKKFGLPVVTEAMTEEQADLVEEYADIIQIGARNIQNFDLLKHAGKKKKPVLLKRGMATTIEEFLMSAEYVMSQGNYNVILCERGIRTFETSTRFTLDLSAVPVLKKLTHLPVIIDPSHATGVREYVGSMSKAALAAGADGLIIEVHNAPEKAASDGPQSLYPAQFSGLMKELKIIAPALGRRL